MGNCCRRESATAWATVDEIIEIEKQWDYCSRAPLLDQVKIKMELEELLASARVQDVPVDRLFSRYINAVHHHSHPHRSWAPTLNSIAE